MGANNQKLWVQLCKLMSATDLLDDPRFSTIALRLANRRRCRTNWSAPSAAAQGLLGRALLANGIPAGPILTYPEAFGSEHAKARNMRMEIDHPVEGKVPNIGFAVKLSARRSRCAAIRRCWASTRAKCWPRDALRRQAARDDSTPGARFGVPIARTLGNTLSSLNFARLRAAWGLQPVRRMLLLAQIIGADEALACGFLEQVCAAEELDAAVSALCARLGALAPVTQAAAKEALRRGTAQGAPDTDDLVRRCYGSRDFREGVDAFEAGRPPAWQGR
jgi:hypothetical protein